MKNVVNNKKRFKTDFSPQNITRSEEVAAMIDA